MIDKLISSKARVEILKLFLFNPQTSYYQRQISSLTGQPLRAVQRELELLVGIGLVVRSVTGKRHYYKVNAECHVYHELRSIFFKTVGVPSVLRKCLSDRPDIEFAFIYGSYAKGLEDTMSDIDIMVIGRISSRRLSSVLSEAKAELGREVNYAIFAEGEFKRKAMARDHFVISVLQEKKIFIVGDEREFGRIVPAR